MVYTSGAVSIEHEGVARVFYSKQKPRVYTINHKPRHGSLGSRPSHYVRVLIARGWANRSSGKAWDDSSREA